MNFNPVFANLPISIFAHMSGLALTHDAVNLGQGFPDLDGPLSLREAAARQLLEGPNQYPPAVGLVALRQAVSDHARTFYGLDYDPQDEVVITSGATEALAACILAVTGPGAEVVLIEPAYDSYRPIAQAAGAVIKTVTLEPPGWTLTEDALRAAIGPKTRVVLLNSPHNPTGRVLHPAELDALAKVVLETDAVVICDEVYEHLVFDGRAHIPLATRAGMRDRCFRIGSAGKIFSLTGWKVGWITAPRALASLVLRTHQFLTFTTPPSLQMGVAHGLAHEMGYAIDLTARLQANRDLLAQELPKLGFAVLPCEGTYFLTAGIAGLTDETDLAFCERLVKDAGVALIPLSPFFQDGMPNRYVRFAFCKQLALIEEALKRLRRTFAR